ncbi:MAG: hypothetical protein HQL84_10505 [Magnetococcales bacterium]|nr:hypothetical protein [Magnetococcales bacterium]MBF0150462.1 hypothetical protein [Magnetococcales bacterium]MBF0174697.1 hypothetical protein [Magnetococcales bacterium]MBF0348146.1 hypothetical protein [Magnetococcales bacterium]MBF0629470.1 hypothetical protein [Magnetococcales bacterium]
MGQSLANRANRLVWLGDMEPEYEDMLEWMLLVEEVDDRLPQSRLPLHWSVIPKTLLAAPNVYQGVACH